MQAVTSRTTMLTDAQRGDACEHSLEALGTTGEQAKRQLEREKRIALVESIAQRHVHLGTVGDTNPATLPTLTNEDWEKLAWADCEESPADLTQMLKTGIA